MSLSLSHSLRARLLWLLLLAIGLTSATLASIAYRTALNEADEIFDFQMQQVALSLRAGLPAGGVLAPRSSVHDDDNFDFVIQVWNADGLRIFESAEQALLPQRAVLGFSNMAARGTTYRIFSLATPSQVIQVAQDLAARRRMATTLALRTVSPMLAALPLLLLLVWWVVTSSLKPVRRVQEQVAARQADGLAQLSEADLPDEIRPLVQELNLLFERVSQAFEAQQHFVEDAAHELRTPLAALKLQVQLLRRAGDEASRELALNRLTAGIDRGSRLVDQLLMLARQQNLANHPDQREVIDLQTLCQQVVVELSPLAAARQIDLGLSHSLPCTLLGHTEALRILLRNLIDNAIKYSPESGRVDVSLQALASDQVLLSVQDSGPGIAPEDRQRVLDRFYRVVGTQASGSGLGLAIVKAICDMHRASLHLSGSESLGGLRVDVLLHAQSDTTNTRVEASSNPA